jgi:hypothetical protein
MWLDLELLKVIPVRLHIALAEVDTGGVGVVAEISEEVCDLGGWLSRVMVCACHQRALGNPR